MKKILCLVVMAVVITSCTPLKKGQLMVARGIAGSETVTVDSHEVYCSEGKVCAEVKVISIRVEDKDGGKVSLTLKNETGNVALVQIRVEIKDRSTRETILETRGENVAIPETQEKTFEIPGISRKGAVVRVLLNRIKKP